MVFAAPGFNVPLHQGLGETLAAQVHQSLGGQGQIVVVAIPASASEVVATQIDAFRRWLATHPGITVAEIEIVDTENKPKYGPGTGLSASRLVRLAKKHAATDALVSFIGLPELDAKELAELGARGPRLFATARDVKKLAPLLGSGRLQRAIVPRFQFPSPVTGDPGTPQEWFDLQFQVISPGNLAPK